MANLLHSASSVSETGKIMGVVVPYTLFFLLSLPHPPRLQTGVKMSVDFELDWSWKRFLFGIGIEPTVHFSVMLFVGFLAIGITFSKIKE